MKYLLVCLLALELFSASLHLSTTSNPSRINPILATDSASGDIANWIFSGLIKYDKDANIVPDLAESYRFLDDRTLLFNLCQDILWSDGVAFSADDVLYTYKIITSPNVFTPYANSFRFIEKVEKIHEHAVKVTYKEPYFKALETWMLGLLPAHLLKDEKELMTSEFNKKPIGVGPYTLKSFKVSQDITLTAYKDHKPHAPHIDTLIYHFIPDPSTSFLMLKSKKLDVGGLTPLQYERQLPEDFKKHFNVYESISHGYNYIGFNLHDQRFKDPRVREAISLAVDRQELIELLFFGHGQVCTGPFLPGSFAFNAAIKAPKVDLQRAKLLLKEAGYDHENPLNFTLSTNSNNPTRIYAAQIIQQQLTKIGVKMKIRAMEWQAFLNTVVLPKRFDAILLGWSLGLMPDARAFWHSSSDKKGGFNLIHFSDKTIDALIEKAEKTTDRAKLSAIYQQLFAMIVEQNAYLFLYIPSSITAVNKKIKNVSPSIIGVMHNQIDWIKD
jgi:peptide/nickel transport system substrate-binding protein